MYPFRSKDSQCCYQHTFVSALSVNGNHSAILTDVLANAIVMSRPFSSYFNIIQISLIYWMDFTSIIAPLLLLAICSPVSCDAIFLSLRALFILPCCVFCEKFSAHPITPHPHGVIFGEGIALLPQGSHPTEQALPFQQHDMGTVNPLGPSLLPACPLSPIPHLHATLSMIFPHVSVLQ